MEKIMQLSKKDFKVKTIFTNVSRTWGNQLMSEVLNKRVALEDCARGYWCISRKADQCKCLMAVNRGEIVGVWEIDQLKGWMSPAQTPKKSWPEDKGDDHPRRGCEFVPADKESHDIIEMRHTFLHHCLCEIAGMNQMYGPIQYSF